MDTDASAEQARSRRLLLVLVAIALGVLTAAANGTLAMRFHEYGAFDDRNIFFDADCDTRLRFFTSELGGRVFLKHPHLSRFIQPPVALVSAILTPSDATAIERHELRRRVGIWVVPIASGLQAMAAFALFNIMGLGVLRSILLTAIGSLSFAQLVYGSVPESFGLSAAFLGGTLLLAGWGLRRGEARPRAAWIALGVFGAGVTVTNAVTVALVLAVVEYACNADPRDAARRTVVTLAAIGGLSLALFWAGSIPGNPQSYPQGIGVFFHGPSAWPGRVADFTEAVADAYTAPEPGQATDPAQYDRGFGFTLSHDRSFDIPLEVLRWALVGATLAGFALCLRTRPPDWPLAAAALAVLSFNLALSTIWGVEAFLYTPHWHGASLVGLAMAARVDTTRGAWLSSLLASAAVVGIAVSNERAIGSMLTQLAATAGQ